MMMHLALCTPVVNIHRESAGPMPTTRIKSPRVTLDGTVVPHLQILI